MRRILLVAVLAALTTGCLLKHTTHTLYLDPDGSISWFVMQQDIRSDADTAEERLAEERAFLDDATAARHDVALAFDELRAAHVETRIVRPERPYAVVTEARFRSVERLGRAFLDQLQLTGTVELRLDGDRARLVLTGWSDPDDDETEGTPPGHVEALLEEPDHYRIVLTEGKFLDAVGFRLESNDTAAVPLELTEEQIERNGGRAIFELSWRSARP